MARRWDGKMGSYFCAEPKDRLREAEEEIAAQKALG
jgi:hypothetical protein